MQYNSNECVICKRINFDISFPFVLKRALHSKYSQSECYFYVKDINNILESRKTMAYIRYRDNEHFTDNQEYLRRLYLNKEAITRMPALVEYYRYHINLPRNFYSAIIGRRNERIRQIYYRKIKIELGLLEPEVKPPDQPSLAEMKDLLKDLDLPTHQDSSHITNSTILKELVQLIPEPKFPTFAPKLKKKPSIDLNKFIYITGQGNFLKALQKQGRSPTLIRTPLTSRPNITKQSSNIYSTKTSPKKYQNPLKSRQSSQISNTNYTEAPKSTKSTLTTEAIAELAKKMVIQRMYQQKLNKKKQNGNMLLQTKIRSCECSPLKLYQKPISNLRSPRQK